MTPAERSRSIVDIAQGPSGSSNDSRARSVATHRRRVMPKSAPSSLSSSMATPSHSSASRARQSSSKHAFISSDAARSSSSPFWAAEASRATRSTSGISRLVATGAEAAPSPSSARKRFCIAMMPSSPRAAETDDASNAGNATSVRSHSMGASVMIVAILREMSASSMCARRFSPILPLTSSAWAITSSKLPYRAINALAFLGPMPGTPGMLSEESPLRP